MLTNPAWVVRTARLILSPVSSVDLGELRALKADPRVFAIMLGGVRTPAQTATELAADISFWGAHGYGIWAIRGSPEPSTPGPDRRCGVAEEKAGPFLGLTGFMHRPDGRGTALRFALWPDAQGQGLAREAAGAALRFGHDRARLGRIVAVARATNIASRTVLGAIGMVEVESFVRDGHRMLLYESTGHPNA